MMAAVGSSVGIGGTLTRPAPILVRVAVPVLAVPARREEVPRAEPAEGGLAEPLERPSSPLPHSSPWSCGRAGGRSPSTSPSVGGDTVPAPPVVPVPVVAAPAGTTWATAILPQTLQYPSSTWPGQPGVALQVSPSTTSSSLEPARG